MSQSDEAPNSRPAATVVIFRESGEGPPELLMMERAGTMAFAAGALVFPGGAVDAADFDYARTLGWPMPDDEAAARIAAVRETIEECGLPIGFTTIPSQSALAEMRAALLGGEAMSDVLARHGVSLDAALLTPFARWHPSRREMVRRAFDTRFYLARKACDYEPMVDATENLHLFWASAREVLDRCDRGEGLIIFPTRRNLERLALFASVDDVLEQARSIPVEKIIPWIEERDGAQHLCIPGHLGYPVTSERVDRASRG